MPRPRKDNSAAARVGRLDRDGFRRFIHETDASRQKLNDAQMANAGVWKKADPQGIHPEAAKLYSRLDNMEDTKRTDFLRAFDIYRGWSDWHNQLDLLDEAGRLGDAGLHADEDDAGQATEESELPFSAAMERDLEPICVEPTPVADVEADCGEEGAAEATEELTRAGHTFAAGRQAALDGDNSEGNPHPEGSTSRTIWERGHGQGMRDKEESEDDVPEGVVRLPRSRRRAAVEASAD